MTETDPIADLEVQAIPKRIWERISVVWLVPLLALIISLGVAWQSYSERGVLISIYFENASGVEAGSTVIKYRDVNVGLVERVEFTPDLRQVVVFARIDRNVAPYLDAATSFWVVRPEVSVRGITGLSTVLSGVFIEGSWDELKGAPLQQFGGLDRAPLSRPGQNGTWITLRARDGNQLASGAPVLHKGIDVGYLDTPELSESGDIVSVAAFIRAPYDRQLTSETRFWDTSGFSISLGTQGVTLDVSSLASLVEGGIAFDTIVSGGQPIEAGHRYNIFEDETQARESLFADPVADDLIVSVIFDESVNGLAAGADVKFQGVRIGRVKDIGAFVTDYGGFKRVRLRANLAIEPTRLGLGEDSSPEAAQEFLAQQVQNGLRARLVSSGLLSTSLVIELIQVPDAFPMPLDVAAEPYPVMPTTASNIADVATTAEGILDRINNLPIEELMASAIDLLNSTEALVTDENLRAAPESLVALLDETRSLVGSEDMQAVPAELRQTIASLNAIVTELQERQVVDQIMVTLESARAAAANLDSASESLPAITQELEALAAKANALDLDGLATAATETLASIDTLLSAQSTQDLPASLGGALDELRVFLEEVRKGGAVDNVNTALASASDAAGAIEQAAAGLPELTERLSTLIDEAGGVLGAYGERSRFNAETLATLRDIQEAAAAINALARTIQRNPNALLTGR